MIKMYDAEKLIKLDPNRDPNVADEVPSVDSDILKQRHQKLNNDLLPLRRAIQASGWAHSSDIWEIKTRNPVDYEMLFPILVEHLHFPYYPLNLEAIVRALTLKKARNLAWEPMKKLLRANRIDLVHPGDPYFRNCCQSLRGAIMNALGVMATKEDLSEVLDMITNDALGDSRILMIVELKNFFDPRVIPVLHKIRSTGKLKFACDSVLKSSKYKSQLDNY
jgi:hypothetical protein